MGGRKGEVGGRYVGGKEKFWGRKKVENKIKFRQGGCVFGSSPKRLERPHPQLVHWWLLIHSSQGRTLSNFHSQ